tara:strand:+ start:5205 stop:6230 length:1026 start_codon:yes stop_codon:yes gene_type:complete
MKVLFHSLVDYEDLPEYGHRLDYLADSVFHGFRDLLGEDAVDYPKMEHMYKENFSLVKTDKCKGFSLYNRLDDIPVDREDIEQKIRNNYFDIVVVAIHHSYLSNREAVMRIVGEIEHLNPHQKIALLDGNDSQGDDHELFGLARYYKREMKGANRHLCLPIAFSIPESVVVDEVPEKTKDFATIVPSFMRHPHWATYVFDEEEKYFADYENSFYGFTCKKGGWDCLRHYEILARGCVPFFTDLEQCPDLTLFNFPKSLTISGKQIQGLEPCLVDGSKYDPNHSFIGTCMNSLCTYNHKINHSVFNKDMYYEIANELLDYTRSKLTTKYIAKYIIETIKIGV